MRIQLYSARKNRRRRHLLPRRQRPFPGSILRRACRSRRPAAATYTAENTPEDVCLTQQVLGFAYAPPLEGTVTSAFGYRLHPIAGENRFHYGVDIDAEEGTGIRAFADGVVGVVAQSSDLGNYVTVDHPGGFTTLYAHCKCITASAGQTVRCGAILAQVGQTGAATGPHLHFELHWDQVYINPVYYVAS